MAKRKKTSGSSKKKKQAGRKARAKPAAKRRTQKTATGRPTAARATSPVADFLELDVAKEEKVVNAAKAAAQVAANLADCNKFVKAVASACGVTIDPGANANAIVDIIKAGVWTPLDDGDNEQAMAKAADGKFVIAAMKNSEFTAPHNKGHVAIVHGHEDAAHPGFPHASWGSEGGTGAAAGTFDGLIRNSFPVVDVDKIHYSFTNI